MKSVMIVDDSEDIFGSLSDLLSDGYTLHLATSGEKAQEILSNEMVNLIVSNVMMPGIDGFELCRLLRSNMQYCHIPIILLTSNNSHETLIEGLEAGADAYLQKPLTAEFLQLQISNLLKNREKVKDHLASSPFEGLRVVSRPMSGQRFLRQLERCIQQNLNDPQLGIEVLSEHLNMSCPTLYRKVRSISKLSPKRLIDTTRVKYAAGLIGENMHSFSEVAKMAGYRSYGLFTRNFRKHFRMTPAEYSNSVHKRSATGIE